MVAKLALPYRSRAACEAVEVELSRALGMLDLAFSVVVVALTFLRRPFWGMSVRSVVSLKLLSDYR